jgi:hypothetical protein
VELLDGLRAAGFTPAAEDNGGGVLDLSDRARRTAPRRRGAGRVVTPPEPDAEQLAELVARMRSGDANADLRRGAAAFANGSALELLRTAVAARRRVWIGFVDGHGRQGERVLEPTNVGGGVVEGRDGADGAVHRVALHRITGIALVEG